MTTPNLNQLLNAETEQYTVVKVFKGRYGSDIFACVARHFSDGQPNHAEALQQLVVSTEDEWYDVKAAIRDHAEFPMAFGSNMADALAKLDERIGCMGPLTREGWWVTAEKLVEELLSLHS